ASGKSSKIDYLIISAGFGKCVESVGFQTTSDIKTHAPVRVKCFGNVASLQALSFMKPPKIPVEQPVGPACQTRSAYQVLDCACRGLEMLQDRPKRGLVQKHLNTLYQEWADLAEIEVAASRRITLHRYGAPGKLPRLMWVSVADMDTNRNQVLDPSLFSFRLRGLKHWQAWLLDGITKEGRRAHRWTKECKAWTATTTLSRRGHIVSDPLALLETEAARFSDMWLADRQPDRNPDPLDVLDPLEALTPDQIRQVSRSYSTRTCISVDGFHMRHFASTSDDCLTAFSIMMLICEATGLLPYHMQVLQMALLSKPQGGFRPIGLFSSSYHLWGRARRRLASAWELESARSYLAASTCNGASDVVWRQSVRSESGVKRGQAAATLLWDLRKFYESMQLPLLEQRAHASGFPAQILRMRLCAYRGA
ncbi:unnamed protein product, partial [Prorocentrum cordatum]